MAEVLEARLAELRKQLDALVEGSEEGGLSAETLERYKLVQSETLELKRRLEHVRATAASHFRFTAPDATELDVCLVGPPHEFLVSRVVASSEAAIDQSLVRGDLPVTVHAKGAGFEVLVGVERRYVDEMRSMRVAPDGRSCTIEWADGTKRPLLSLPDSVGAFEEAVGAHLQVVKWRRVRAVDDTKRLWAMQREAVDADKHDGLLRRLWDGFFPSEPFERVSERWKAAGFQGTNPMTDFRGMGLLGLHCLLYALQHHRPTIVAIVERRNDYPFAAAGINVTKLLFDKLCARHSASVDLSQLFHSSPEFDTPLMTWVSRIEHAHALEELYVVLTVLLDATFRSMRASYMDFPHVIRTVGAAFDALIALQPRSVEHLRAMLDQRVLFLNE